LSAVRLAFTWLGVRKTLAREQRTTAATAFQADRELLSATKLILDTKHPSFRNVARVRSEASGYWRTETLPFPEPGVRLLPQNKLAGFDARMSQFRQELVVGTDGDVRCVYDESLDRRALGKLQITRASHVEPDSDGNWWADIGPVDGRVGALRDAGGGASGGEGVAQAGSRSSRAKIQVTTARKQMAGR